MLMARMHHSHAAHIKTELHRLRKEAPTKLSAPRRAALGLDVWPTAIKKAGKLQAEDSRASELLRKTLKAQMEAGELIRSSLSLGES
jgi:hypothetical protein